MVVSYRLSTVTIRPQFAIDCLRRSNQQRVGYFGDEGVDRRKPNFNTASVCEIHGAVVCRRNRADIFCRLSTMHERDRQTDRYHETVRSIAIGEIGFQRCRLKIQSNVCNQRSPGPSFVPACLILVTQARCDR